MAGRLAVRELLRDKAGEHKMKRYRKGIVVLAIAWAVCAPIYVSYRNATDQQERRLINLAAARLGASADDMTNEIIRIPRGSVDAVRYAALMEGRRSEMFQLMTFVSSAMIVLLAIALLSQPKSGP